MYDIRHAIKVLHDENQIAAMKEELSQVKTLFDKQFGEYESFCKQNGLKVDQERLYVGNQKYSVAKSVNNDIINNNRNMANGMRKSPLNILDDKQIERINQYADELQIPRNVLSYNTGFQTGFSDRKKIINIRGDIFPDKTSYNNRDLLSERAVLAHEYYGHMKHDPSNFDVGDWRDEFRASYAAAIKAPGLSDEERRMLMIDAYDRAKEAGVPVKYNKKAREIIYGYVEE